MCEQIGAVSPAATLKQGQQSLEETERADEQQSQEAMQRNAEGAARALEEQKIERERREGHEAAERLEHAYERATEASGG
jgi:hypothetical protein